MQEIKNYKIIETADGSPSLEGDHGEAMHNRKGALSETLEIYGGAFMLACEMVEKPKTLSVGLGLGYNEIMIAALALKSQKSELELLSYEVNDELRSSWLNWIIGKDSILAPTYEKICHLLEVQMELNKDHIKPWLVQQYENQIWKLDSRLDSNTLFSDKFNCILYDPFSSKTNPECWDENFIIELLTKCAAQNCVLSSYASKGTLKRALKNQGFIVNNPEGFGGKGNRTLAVRS